MVWIGHISVSLRFKKWIKTFYKYVCVCSRSLFICLLPQKRLMWLICLFLVHPKWQNVFLLDLWFVDLDLFSLQENRINIQKSIQTLSLLHIWLCCSLTLKWFKYIFPSSIYTRYVAQLPPVSLDHLKMFLHLDLSPPVVNSIDWTWFGKTHICLSTGHEVEGTACRSQRQDPEEGYKKKKFCCIEGHREQSGFHDS